MSIKERIKLYLKHKNVSERKFASTIGVSPSYVSAISRSIQPDKMAKISNQFPDLNTGWLMTGEGEMLKGDKKDGLDAAKLIALLEAQQETNKQLSDTINRQSKIIEKLTK